MGIISSRRLERYDAYEDDLVQRIQSLITSTARYRATSGMHMVIDDQEEDYMIQNNQKPPCIPVANTTKLDNSDVSLSIKQACSFKNKDESSKSSVPSMIHRRAIGPNFSNGEKCRISSNYLPNYMQRIAKYDHKPFCGTFSDDGKYLLATTHDRLMRLYSVDNGEYNEYKKYEVSAVGWSILDTAFSPDGNYFVYSSWAEYLYLHYIHGDSNVREPLLLCSDHPMFCVFSVVFSGDGRELFCGGNDGHLYIYDRGSQKCSKVRGHESDINTVAFAESSSQILYSAGDDGLCKVWDRRALSESNPQPVGVLAGHKGGITFVDPRGDGRHLITNSKDQTIKLWDARVFSSKNGLANAQKAVAFTSDSWDYRWQRVPNKFLVARKPLEDDTSIMTYTGHIVIQTLIRCRFSPLATTGQRYIYTGCGTGRVIIYDILTGKIVRSMQGHKTVVRDVHWHPIHQEIVSTSWDGVIASWRYRNESAMDSSESDDELQRNQRKRSSRIRTQRRLRSRNT